MLHSLCLSRLQSAMYIIIKYGKYQIIIPRKPRIYTSNICKGCRLVTDVRSARPFMVPIDRKEYFGEPWLEMFRFSCDIPWVSKQLSCCSCSYDIFIDRCPYSQYDACI